MEVDSVWFAVLPLLSYACCFPFPQRQQAYNNKFFAPQRKSGVLTASEKKKLRGPFYNYNFRLHLLSLLSTFSQLAQLSTFIRIPTHATESR